MVLGFPFSRHEWTHESRHAHTISHTLPPSSRARRALMRLSKDVKDVIWPRAACDIDAAVPDSMCRRGYALRDEQPCSALLQTDTIILTSTKKTSSLVSCPCPCHLHSFLSTLRENLKKSEIYNIDTHLDHTYK